jgi:NAD+ kinase
MSVRVALIVHGGRGDAQELAAQTAASLDSSGVSSCIVALTHDSRESGDLELAGVDAELFVSLGGDGTFLRAARRSHETDTPILGVNFGRVGYLLDLPPTALDQVILDTLAGKTRLEERAGLSILIRGSSEAEFFAVNELSVEKTVPGHVVRLATSIDGEPLLTYAADGVLLATPMGSTAYNLSAGGPVLAPLLDAFVVTPVAPHLVVNRSVVLGGDQVVELSVVGERPVVCVVDGLSVATLEPGESIEVRRHARWLKVVALAERSMALRLRESLRQGHE